MTAHGANIRAARQALGLSLQGLADLLMLLDRQSLRRYEDGSRTPSGPVLVALAFICRDAGFDPRTFGLPAPPVAPRGAA